MIRRSSGYSKLGLVLFLAAGAFGCDTGEEVEGSSQALQATVALDTTIEDGTLTLAPLQPYPVLTGGAGELAALTHTCATGSSKDSCAAFTDACKRYTGYDATSKRGDVGNAVTYTCSCDGPQVANSDFCDRKIGEAQQ